MLVEATDFGLDPLLLRKGFVFVHEYAFSHDDEPLGKGSTSIKHTALDCFHARTYREWQETDDAEEL